MVLSTRSIATVALGLAAASALAAPARADLVVLSSGRVISAASVVLSDETATIRLRGGGEVTCDRSLVVRVDPDETPWVDPAGSAAPDQAGEATDRAVATIAPAAVKPVEIPAAYRRMITRLAEAHGVD